MKKFNLLTDTLGLELSELSSFFVADKI